MSSLIETVTLDEVEHEDQNAGLMRQSEMYWKDFLKGHTYNKDLNKMCELCIEDQIVRYGSQTIPCKGLATAKNVIESEAKGLYASIIEGMTEQDIESLEEIYNPSLFMENNCDTGRRGDPKRLHQPRWFQDQILACTAQSKVVRCGRRVGKTHSLATLIVHKCVTEKDHRALLVSPFQVQTAEVADTIKKICASFENNPIDTSSSSPIEIIRFKNGATFKGFTAGPSGANTVRGQPAHSLWLDEIDDMTQVSITSISGILMDNPNVQIWKSGTPKGETNLYKASQSNDTKEFYFPSFVIPHYTDALDKQLRSEMDEIGYLQEVQGVYGAIANGVFQNMFIERAQQRDKFISYADVINNRNKYLIIAGVDWNHDKVGTRIVVVACDKQTQHFYIVDRERVAVEGWTQQRAKERIIDINRKYHLDHVFVDAGFGATQIGDLRLFGETAAISRRQSNRFDDPVLSADAKLIDLQAVDYGSNIELIDPSSGERFKQGMKQYAVQNCVQILERDMLALDHKADEDIIKQMKNYVEKSRLKGKVTYAYISKKIGDHDLDALMIALYGFKKEYSSIFVGSSSPAMMRIVGRPDERVDYNDPNMDYNTPSDSSFLANSLKFGNRRVAKTSQRVVKLGITRSNRR